MKKEADDEPVLDVEKCGGGKTQRSTRSSIVACDSIQAASFQMKGTLKEHKSRKEDIPEKPNIERKPVVRCDKLIVYDAKKGDKELESEKDEVTEKDDSYYEGCSMPAMKGYTSLQTARRGTPYKCNPMGEV